MSFPSLNEVVAFATELRHELHRRPEVTWEEHHTSAKLAEILDHFRVPWQPCTRTGLIVRLAAQAKGAHIALRADIDALPVQEATSLSYASENEGRMHACGHDGHVATLITCALWLKKHEVQLPGPVSLLFQPAEEGGHGAKAMIAEGALEGVDRIYGWHNWPAIPFGHATCPDGIVMAVNGTFHIQLHGKGGHSSQPELCRDPVLAASALNLALQQIVSRRIPPQRVAVLSVTSIIASGGLTTIPDLARMHGSIRVEDDPMRDNMAQWIEEIAHQVAGAYGVRAEVEFRRRYNATINDPHCARQMREVLKAELGEGWKSEHLVPVMASEDFSYYLERIPGAYALVGSDDGVASHSIPCHNSCYDFNDRLIKPVSRCLMRLAGLREAYLHGLW